MASLQGSDSALVWHVFFFVIRSALQRTNDVVFE